MKRSIIAAVIAWSLAAVVAAQALDLRAVATLSGLTNTCLSVNGATLTVSSCTATLSPASNTVPLTVSGYSVTGAGTSALLSLGGTLNTTGSPDVIDVNIAQTAKGANTNLVRVRDGATNKFVVNAAGTGTFAGGLGVGGTTPATTAQISLSNGGALVYDFGIQVRLNASPNVMGNVDLNNGSSNSQTSGGGASVGITSVNFNPASGSGSYAALHVNPIINGVSSGTAYGLLLASKTNTLTGGTVKLASFGTTTTDGFTGYTEGLGIGTDGGLVYAGIAQASLGTPANGKVIYCTDCTIANPCAGGGTGALAKRLNGVWVCN